MTNTLKLRALLIENGYTNSTIAERLGISKQSFCMKINNKREFKITEILNLVYLLKLSTPEEFLSIFFAKVVELKSTNE